MAFQTTISSVNRFSAVGAPSYNTSGGGSNVAASATWAATNLIIAVPLKLEFPFNVLRCWVFNGTASTDHWDVGVYDIDGKVLLVHCGDTAQSGSSVIQSVAAITPITLAPGMYLMAMGNSGTASAYIMGAASTSPKLCGTGLMEHANGYSSGLPSALTLAAVASFTKIPHFGICSGSVV